MCERVSVCACQRMRMSLTMKAEGLKIDAIESNANILERKELAVVYFLVSNFNVVSIFCNF